MAPDVRPLHFEGVHCTLVIEKRSDRVVLMKISGTDVGEFGDAPMKAMDESISGSSGVDLFIDARDVRGASIDVSGGWAAWLIKHQAFLRSITMLTGSRFVQITADFVRRYANLEKSMNVCTDAGVFDELLTARELEA